MTKTMKTFKEIVEHWDDQMPEGAEIITVSTPMTSNPTPTPMSPRTLDPTIVSALEARLKDEYTAHLIYKNAANWCKNVNYKHAADFF